MRLATVQSATTVRIEGATTDSTVWRSAVPLVAGDVVLAETIGTQLVVVSSLSVPRPACGRAEFRAVRATTSTTLAASSWTTYPLESLVTNIGGGTYNTSTFKYYVPSAGLYLASGRVRIADNAAARSVGLGIGVTNADGPDVAWQQLGGAARDSMQIVRLMRLAAGDDVRLFLYSEGATFATHYYGSAASGQSLHLLKVAD